ncbi:MAG: hypothetical protein HKO07_00710 [Pseudomonadales bacterium]|nr:hypothetical protein [Pseudomonadales bacterium]
MPDPTLSIAACAALERALNFAVSIDDTAALRVAKHSGSVVKLYANEPALCVFVVLGERCRVLHHFSDKPDVSLGGALADWFELARSRDKTASLINGNLLLHGDSKILISLAEIAGEIDIDWEEQLAELVGDVPAHVAGRALRNAAQIGTQAAGIAKIALDRVIEQHSLAQAGNAQAGSSHAGSAEADGSQAGKAPADLLGDGLRALRDGLASLSNSDEEKTAAADGDHQ